MNSSKSNAGPIAARQGYKYQDHVAAGFVITLLGDPELLQVECETSDDIVLVWQSGGTLRHEYVQVKTTEDNKKWSLKEITDRDTKNVATSLVEKSLLCDSRPGFVQFRIVSRRDVGTSLRVLRKPRESRSGDMAFVKLAAQLARKRKTKSANNRDLAYWAEHALWEVHGSKEALIATNTQMLWRLASQHGTSPTHPHIQEIYSDLLIMVIDAGDADAGAPEKAIHRTRAESWWHGHLEKTETALQKSAKPYRPATDDFFVEIHNLNEETILRALTGYDAGYDFKVWRTQALAEYLCDWIPEITIKASELTSIRATSLRRKFRDALQEIRRHQPIVPTQLLAETLLHAIVRHHFTSEPIACKLFYQSSNGNKSFRGAHIVHRTTGDELWLGRAAIAGIGDMATVVNAIATSLQDVLDPAFLGEERKVILMLREPQHLLPTGLEKVLDRSSPVDALLKVLCVPILVAYDSDVLAEGFVEDYKQRLIPELVNHYETLKPALPETMKQVNVRVFLVPVQGLTALVKQFEQQLGL